MDQINTFINTFNIQPGYVIKSKSRSLFQFFDHYCIYLGVMYFPDFDDQLGYQHVFAGNFPPGPQFFGEERALQFLQKYYPVEINSCFGGYCNPFVRAQRAIDLTITSQEHYNLLLNNCQDFVNQATTGQKGSYQRTDILWGLGLGLAALALFGAFDRK